MVKNVLAPSKVRKQPEIFCLTLQVVRVAQGVRAIDLLVAGQPIVHQGATHASQEPQFLKGLCATFGVLAQPRQAGADQAVQPVQVALDADAALIGMHHRLRLEGLTDGAHRGCQRMGALGG